AGERDRQRPAGDQPVDVLAGDQFHHEVRDRRAVRAVPGFLPRVDRGDGVRGPPPRGCPGLPGEPGPCPGLLVPAPAQGPEGGRRGPGWAPGGRGGAPPPGKPPPTPPAPIRSSPG